MRFLRVLGFVLVDARAAGEIVLPVVLGDDIARLRDRFRREVDAVGTHIRDEAGGLAFEIDAFIETLCKPHGVRGREAQLAARFLLERRGRERRVGVAFRGLRFDRSHFVARRV